MTNVERIAEGLDSIAAEAHDLYVLIDRNPELEYLAVNGVPLLKAVESIVNAIQL